MEGDEPGTFSDNVTRNMKRGAELLEEEDDVEALVQHLAQKRRRLQAQRQVYRNNQILASLRIVGRSQTWLDLPISRRNYSKGLLRWDKQVVLAILSCQENKPRLPPELTEPQWNKCYKMHGTSTNPQKALCRDLDIFVARLRRPEFAQSDAWKRTWLNQFKASELRSIPTKELILVLPRLPEMFTKAFGNGLCRSKELAETYLGCCPKNCRSNEDAKAFLGTLAPELKVDHRLILLTLQQFPSLQELPAELIENHKFAIKVATQSGFNCAHWLQQFAHHVRGNYAVALAFCRANGSYYPLIPIGIRKKYKKLAQKACQTRPDLLFTTVPGNIERQLTSDKDFIISLLSKLQIPVPSNMFQILSPALKESPEVLAAAVKRGLLRLSQVPKQLQDIVREDLMQCTTFVMANLKGVQTELDEVQCADARNLALRAVQLDRSMAMLAIRMGHLPVVPACFTCDPRFWKELLETAPRLWGVCPFFDDINFARAFESPDQMLASKLLEQFDSLRSDLEFWRRLHFDADFYDVEEFVTKYASREVLEDKDIMRRAISHDYFVYDALPSSLKKDREIVESLVSTGNERAFFVLSLEARTAHPDLAIKAMQMVLTEDLYWVYEDILEPNEWSNRDIARVWLGKGGAWLTDDFPDEFREDTELMFLLAAKNGQAFGVAKRKLRWNKAFVLRVLEKNGMAYRHVDESLIFDFDVVLSAWATSVEVGDIFFEREQYRFATNFASQVRARLRDHDIFLRTVLCGTCAERCGSSPLQNLLVQLGEETSLVFRKRLAELLDIPIGKELTKLRKASKHLELWGY